MKPSRKKQSRAQKKKEKAKQKNLKNDQSEEDESDALDFNKEDQAQQIDVSFAISEINEKQYHSLKTLLEKFATITSITSAEWADLVIKNAKTGNVAVADEEEESDQEEGSSSSEESEQEQEQEQDEQKKPNEEEDDEQNVCTGALAILPDNSKQVKAMIKKMATSAEKNGKNIKKYLKKGCNNSFLVNERAINLPAFVVQSMHEVLVKEIEVFKQEEKEIFEKVAGKIWVSSWVEKTKSDSKDDLIYSKFEDYQMLKRCEEWWLGEGVPGITQRGDLRKLYYIIDWQEYAMGVKDLKSLLIQQ